MDLWDIWWEIFIFIIFVPIWIGLLHKYDFVRREPFDHWHVLAATRVLSRIYAQVPLKYQQPLKIIYTTKSGCLPSCFRGLLKAIYFVCVRFSIPSVGGNPTTKSYFWLRIPIDVHIKATYDSYCRNSFLIRLVILFAFFSTYSGNLRRQHYWI